MVDGDNQDGRRDETAIETLRRARAMIGRDGVIDPFDAVWRVAADSIRAVEAEGVLRQALGDRGARRLLDRAIELAGTAP